MLESTLQNFVNNFIQKDRKDRISQLLQDPKKRVRFTDRLNHRWDTVLDMRRLEHIPKVSDDYAFVKQALRISDKERCIIISNHGEIDGQSGDFETAFNAVYGRGFGSIIITSSGDNMYLETEVVPGRQNRFVSKIGITSCNRSSESFTTPPESGKK